MGISNKLHSRVLRDMKYVAANADTNGMYSMPTQVSSDTIDIFINGPKDSPYEGFKFLTSIKFTTEYPFEPPKISFKTKFIHTNVSNGGICLDILREQWTPQYTLDRILISLISLLDEPNFSSPLNNTPAVYYRQHTKEEYFDYVKKDCEANCPKITQ
jgi:ubiquitin-conjugating enzyme E2 D/E